MLQLLIGPSGSGKTHYILENLATLTAQGHKKILWLVPEQYSFESERAILRALGPVQAAQVRVTSFSRLADMIEREVGGLAGQRLDEGVRALLMSRALTQVAAVAEDTARPVQGLRMRLSTDSAYVEQLLSLWQELRRCAVPTEELERVAAELSDEEGMLPQKVEALYRVFAAYEGLAVATGLDDLDDLTRLADRLPDSALPDDAIVFVDGFKGFTQQELQVLKAFIPRARQITIALCTDTPGSEWEECRPSECRREFPLFSPVTATINQLRRIAGDNRQWELIRLTENRRTHSEALAALERGLYAPSPVVYEGDASEVTVTPCADVYEECAYAVRQIRRLLREEHYRCRDITVAVRNLPDYQGILDEMLHREGIPCYMDTRQDVLCEPLVVYLRSALRLAVGGWRTEEMLRLMKTDLWPLSATDIAEIENYVYTWGIEGNRWEQEWTENPAGLDGKENEYTRATLARLNARRGALMKPLMALRASLRGKVTGRQFAMAVYTWLGGQKSLPSRIKAQIEILEELAQPVLAAHAERLWDQVMLILDRFALALGEQAMPATQLEELFTMLCRTIDMGSIPQSLDAVTVGSADRIRYSAPRAVFVLGANEGVFPAYPMGEGILSEEERDRLKERGIDLAEDVLTQCVVERYYAYLALSAPSERLIVTYHTAGESAPSPLVNAIDIILPHHAKGVARKADGSDLESAHEMFACLAQEMESPTALTPSLRRVLSEQIAYAPRLAAVDRSAQGKPFRIEHADTALKLFGENMCLSATQVEKFYHCHFSYFCRYGLHIKPRRAVQVDASVFGTLVHYLMETLLPTYTVAGGLVDSLRDKEMTPEEDRRLTTRLQEDVRVATAAYIEAEMGGAAEKSGRFLYQVGLAERSACNMLWHLVMELRQSDFVPVDFELNIHPEEKTDVEGIVSLRLPTSVGSVQINGSIDRVDLYRRFDGTVFVRVVDYKTGAKTFEMNEITEGLGTQMLLYLFILCDNSRRYLEDGAIRPAGVLYHPLSDLVLKRGQDDKQRLKQMCMSGIVLDDPSVVLAMEKEKGKLFIPAELNKEGNPTGNVVTPHQFDLLRKTVESLLVGMADKLAVGDIDALPLQKKNEDPCQYCDYKPVCARDAEDAMRELTKRSMKQVLEDMETAMEEVSDHE